MAEPLTILAGDVGGTKTKLAVFNTQSGAHTPLAEAVFPSARFDSLGAIVEQFLADVDIRPSRAVFGVAGPVIAGQATITNLPWKMSETGLSERLGIPEVRLLNDLVSIANAIPILEPADLETLNPGQPVEGGAIGVVAPGTGLGEAYLTWDGRRYHAYASEGGHADFAPINALQLELLAYLQARRGHVSYEMVCSGKGLPNIYDFLRDQGHAPEPDWLALELSRAEDRTPVIVSAAMGPNPPDICRMTVEIFVSILGAEAGNMALKVLAAGGMYLGGGIPPRLLPLLRQNIFMDAFCEKGRFCEFMRRVPIHVILNTDAALLGAARFALNL